MNLTMEQDFYSHREIYFLSETTMDSLGLYEYTPTPSLPDFLQLFQPPELDFVVVLPGKDKLTATYRITITVFLCGSPSEYLVHEGKRAHGT